MTDRTKTICSLISDLGGIKSNVSPVSGLLFTPLLMCSECVSLSVNFYRKSGGVRMRGRETSSSAQRDVPEFLSFSHRKLMLLDYFR